MPHKNEQKSQRARARSNTYTVGGRKNAVRTTGKKAVDDPMSGSSSQNTMSLRYIPLFAQRTRRNLIYAPSGLTLNPGASLLATAYVFSANGCYDPDITGSGSQPMGFDQMMSFYNHYTVIKSRIRLLATNTSSTAVANVALLKSGSSTVTTSVEQLLENGDAEWGLAGFHGAQGSTVRLQQSCDVARYQGIDNPMDDPNMRGDSASNPVEQMYYHFAVWSLTAVALNAYFQPVIEYDVVFHEPKKGPLS